MSTCWGVVKSSISAADQLEQLVGDELGALSPVGSAIYVERAVACLKEGRKLEALDDLARALTISPVGPGAEAALKILLGPLLQGGGIAALRSRLFGT